MKTHGEQTDDTWADIVNSAESACAGATDSWIDFWRLVAPIFNRWAREPTIVGGRISQREDWRHDVVLDLWERLQHNDFRRLRLLLAKADEKRLLDAHERARYARSYLRVSLRRVSIDFTRRLPEYVRHRQTPSVAGDRGQATASGRPGGTGRRTSSNATSVSRSSVRSHRFWRSLVTYTSRLDPVAIDMETRLICQEAFQVLHGLLSPPHRFVLDLFERGASWQTLGSHLGLADAEQTQRLVARMRERRHYPAVLELWLRGYDQREIAEELSLTDAAHAGRLLRAAKAILRRHFATRAQEEEECALRT